MLVGEAAVKNAAKYIGQHEEGGNNRGAFVQRCQASTDLPGTAWPWCAAFVSLNLQEVGFDVTQIHGRASVGFLLSWAKAKGYVAATPQAGDIFCWFIDGDSWPDHTGFVERVISVTDAYVTVQTIEGNTSSGIAGSQDNGDGVYRRTRVFQRSRVSFIRIPEKVVEPDTYWDWLAWTLGEGKYKGHAMDQSVRPNVPKRISPLWWARRKLFLARRAVSPST